MSVEMKILQPDSPVVPFFSLTASEVWRGRLSTLHSPLQPEVVDLCKASCDGGEVGRAAPDCPAVRRQPGRDVDQTLAGGGLALPGLLPEVPPHPPVPASSPVWQ